MMLLSLALLLMLTRLSMISAYPMYADILKTKRAAPEGVHIVYPEPLVLGSELIPDRFHPFMAPGPNDMRGPCPGLNVLANHGYLPRNGIASVEHIINAAQVGFNLGYGFSKAVASFAVLSRGNPLLNLVSIGRESPLVPPLPGNIDGIPGGLSKPGRFEGDVSMTRQDAAFGDSASFQPSMFENLLTYVERFGQADIVTPEVFVNYRFDLFLQSISKNPKMTFHEGRRAFGYGEAGLILDLMPDGRTGNLTTPTMSTFLVNESFPSDWHRRNASLEFDQISLVTGAVITPRPVPRGAKNGEGVFVADENPFQGGCDLYVDIVRDSLPAVFMNTTGLLRKNIDTLLEGVHDLFRDACPEVVVPAGPAGV